MVKKSVSFGDYGVWPLLCGCGGQLSVFSGQLVCQCLVFLTLL